MVVIKYPHFVPGPQNFGDYLLVEFRMPLHSDQPPGRVHALNLANWGRTKLLHALRIVKDHISVHLVQTLLQS